MNLVGFEEDEYKVNDSDDNNIVVDWECGRVDGWKSLFFEDGF